MNLTEMTDAMLNERAAIAMGWHLHDRHYYTDESLQWRARSFSWWNPAVNESDAFELAEKCGLFYGGNGLFRSDLDERWEVCCGDITIARATTPARAITEACLLATEGK